MNIGQFLDSWGIDGHTKIAAETPVIVCVDGVRHPCLGDMVIFVDEQHGDYNHHDYKPALVQHLYIQKGFVHLHVFEDKPQDNRSVDAFYSNQHEPGTFHFVGD